MKKGREKACSSDQCSLASEGWTSDSTEPDTTTPSLPSPTPTEGESSSATGPGSPSTRTCETWGVSLVGTDYVASSKVQPPLKAGNDRVPPLTFSVAGSPAKTSPSPDDDEGSQASAPASSSSSPESPMTLWGTEDGSSLRTYPDSFPPTVDEISPSYSRRWPSSGSVTSPGECWTHDSSEFPSGGGASSSLPDVLQATAPERFSLSPRAAAGILRRAEKRGRELPQALQADLTALASTDPGDARKTT